GGLAKAITSFEELVMITVRGSALETSRGLIQRVTQPLADENINIFGLVTMSSSIKIFLSKEQAERAISRIKTGLVRDDEKS
ncbi:MAG: ACT domain-containing protein, partial [Thaumarchaeota archaeon]|nr:ACT domain-containing protein [Nitrososphaerota archaeon]